MKHLVTDHAVLRYLERVRDIDVEALRQEIAQLLGVTAENPPRRAKVVGGFLFHVKDGQVVTVVRPEERPRCRRQRHHELRDGDTREPGTRPVSYQDPWWYTAAAGPDHPREDAGD